MEALVVGKVERVAVVLADEVVIGVGREIGVDADGVVVGDGEPALVEGPVVVLAGYVMLTFNLSNFSFIYDSKCQWVF